MAAYKYAQLLTEVGGNAFDIVKAPGSPAEHSGIYRCEGCGHEVASNMDYALPPQNHHPHAPGQGQIRWRLAVRTA